MDINIMATKGSLIRQEEKAARDARTEFATQEFEDNFDELFVLNNQKVLPIRATDGKNQYLLYKLSKVKVRIFEEKKKTA